MVDFKVFLSTEGGESEIRRFTMPDRICYGDLRNKIFTGFPALRGRLFTMYWQDEEGDDIAISTDDDLNIALRENVGSKYQKIYVKVPGLQDEDSDASSFSYEETNIDDIELEHAAPYIYVNATEQQELFQKPKKLSIVLEEEESEECNQEEPKKSDSDEKSDSSNTSVEEIYSDDELEDAINEALQPYDNIDTSDTEHQESRRSGEAIHSTVTCNGCNQHPLYGFRYKCLVCYDYDLCINCEKSQQIHTEHPMLRIPVPITLETPMGKSYENVKNNMLQNLRCLLLD